MLVTLTVKFEGEKFPTSALDEMDAAMSKVGYMREARTVVEWGKHYATSYEGPVVEDSKIEESVTPIASKYSLKLTIEKEESHHFP